MRPHLYILDEHRQVKVAKNVFEWGDWIEQKSADGRDNRRVEETFIGDIRISTVFLGMDHNFSDEGPPIVFETMVFGGVFDEYMERYETYSQAQTGHWEIVNKVKESVT